MIKFGTGGFRGIINEDFTDENIHKIIHGIAHYIYKNGLKKVVVIGYDFRLYSFETANLIKNKMLSFGISVFYNINPSPSPTIMYLTKYYDSDIGIMITASHNPSNYNGVKVFTKGGMDASFEVTSALELLINNPSEFPILRMMGVLKEVDGNNIYLDFVKTFKYLDDYSKVKILFDPIYGTSSLTIPPLFNSKNLTMVNGVHDVTFNGLEPNPIYANVINNKELLLKDKYDVCISTDSDGDRLGILDELGNYLDNNIIMACIYYYLHEYRHEKGPVIKNIATSKLIDHLAVHLNEKCITVDVGFKNISSALLEYDALLGGESSGGLTIRNYILGKDATLASLLFIEMLLVINKPISQIINEVKSFANFYRVTTEVSLHFTKKEELFNYFLSLDVKSIYSDFLSIELFAKSNLLIHFLDDKWLLLRLSGTEPLLRVICEAENVDENLLYINKVKEIIKGI